MKAFLILISLELFKIVMSSPVHRAGLSHFLKRSRHHHRGRHLKSNLKLQTYPHRAKPIPAVLPNTPNEQDSMLERTSPEYRYNDDASKNVGKTQDGTSSGKLTQNLPLGDSLTSAEHKSIGTRINAVGVRPMAIGPPGSSLEELNMMLTNSLPEYKYDKGMIATGSYFDKCADLDPDCRRYEMQGLCSDNPTFALKRFNCKKTCQLCNRIGGIVGGMKKRKKHN